MCVIVDDEPGVRAYISRLLESASIATRSFESGEEFLQAMSVAAVGLGCLILDVGLSGVSGLDVLAKVRRASQELPIIVISGTATFGDAARAFQDKADAVFAKPIDSAALVASVQALMARWRQRTTVRSEIEQRLATLSAREREVLDALVEGKNTSQIAHALGISPSTVEKHRLRVFEKTRIDTVVGLIHWLAELK